MGKIVFVVGAGASCEFGSLPQGNELAQRIEAQLSREIRERDGPVSSALMGHGGLLDEHRHAMTRIIRGIHSRDSIDQFVDDCRAEPMVATIAKLAIAHVILSAEDTSDLRIDESTTFEATLRAVRETWLGHVCRYANPSTNRQNFLGIFEEISFVTFNYDRSIERLLLLWAQATLLIEEAEAAELVDQIPVVHVFGSMGHLPALSSSRETKIEFGEVSPSSIWRASQRIKTFTEEVGSVHAVGIRELLADADKIVFLGFHFHRQNLEILFRNGWPRGKLVFGTTFGMSVRAKNRVTNGLGEAGNNYTVEDFTCRQLMGVQGEVILDDE